MERGGAAGLSALCYHILCELAAADAVHEAVVADVVDSLFIPLAGHHVRVLHNGNTASGLGILLADGAAELGLDVGKDSLRVGHGRITGLENLGVLEHREAVAAVGDGVVDAAVLLGLIGS